MITFLLRHLFLFLHNYFPSMTQEEEAALLGSRASALRMRAMAAGLPARMRCCRAALPAAPGPGSVCTVQHPGSSNCCLATASWPQIPSLNCAVI